MKNWDNDCYRSYFPIYRIRKASDKGAFWFFAAIPDAFVYSLFIPVVQSERYIPKVCLHPFISDFGNFTLRCAVLFSLSCQLQILKPVLTLKKYEEKRFNWKQNPCLFKFFSLVSILGDAFENKDIRFWVHDDGRMVISKGCIVNYSAGLVLAGRK